MRVFRVLPSILLVCTFWILALFAWGEGESNSEKGSLEGLSGVYVLIEQLGPEAKVLGLTREAIQTTAELELRKAKINILSKEESARTADSAYLYININAQIRDSGIVDFSLSVSLKQRVQLSNGKKVFASTWDSGSLGKVEKKDIAQIRTGYLIGHLETFVNDFLTANPDKS